MVEIQDSDFLRILREQEVVSPEQVRSARELQRSELDQQGSCRTLFSILCAKGLIDERVARTLRPPSSDESPHTPTVVLPPPDETPSDVRRVNQPSTISAIRSARKRPPEVEVAAVNPKNTLGLYILVREVGKGGMGRVYYAWDENVGRYVALKVIDTEDQADRERFVREAQIAGRLSHPSIATVYHAGEVETRGYIAMQFIEGGPIDAHKLPLLSALALIRDAAQALSYAHEQGVVHRDVKPGNLMVDGKGHVFLTDFGLAKEVVGEAGTKLSITGTTFGTPQFMSPEQARGEHRKIDGRSDVYSLGATLYALLAGRPPFTSTNLATLLLEVLDKKPPPVSRFNKEISPELQMLVERAMAKEPEKRFPTMAAFSGALDRMIREGRYSGRYGMAKALARRWFPRLAAAAALGAALWFGLPVLLAPPPPPPAEDPSLRWYATAVAELRTIEGQTLEPPLLRERVERGVLKPLLQLLERTPGSLRGRAALARALYVMGDRDGAAQELAAAGGRKEEDYRLLLVSSLLQLEAALADPPPIPVLEAPAFEWDRPPTPPPSGIDAAAQAKVGADLASDYKEDRPEIEGLTALSSGDYAKAADLLRRKPLPVYQAAWCRAAYLARRFSEVRAAPESKGRRERLGAGLALATGSPAELQALLPEAGADAPAIHAALARMEGADPHIDEGLKGASPEREASLVSVRLQSGALTGADAEAEYRRAMGLAGESPSTWPGRLAAIELRLGLGSKTRSHPQLEEAMKRADALVERAPGWAAPRLLAAQARLRLGRADEARAELSRLPTEARKGARACLLASAIELEAAQRERKSGGSGVAAAAAAQREALAAPGNPPEASMLWGAAALVLAQDATDREKDEGEFVVQAVESLTRAIERIPGYIDARYHRASAMFLQVGIEQRKGGTGRAAFEGMWADANAALAGSPGHLSARYLRAIASYHLDKPAEALADWKALIQADKSYDRPLIRSWIEDAERKLKK